MGLFGNLFGSQNDTLILEKVVKKRNNLVEGIFANINNDLNEAIQELGISLNENSTYDEKLLFMSYAYARRTVAAALVLQGVFSIKDFQHAYKFFQAVQVQTIHTKEFQELSSLYGHQYILSYDSRLTIEILRKILMPVLQDHSDDIKTAKDIGMYFSYEDILKNIP